MTTALQISGVGPIPEAELVRICAGEGLAICATHEDGRLIVDETQRVIDRLGALGTTYTAYPALNVPLTTMNEVWALAAKLDTAGARMHAAGQVLTYHNHTLEFRRFGGVATLQHLYDRTDPRHLQGELDTYWVAAGGESRVEWVTRLHGRLPLLHLKDYGVDNKNTHAAMMEIGNGNLNWPGIIHAADRSGTGWFIVEQDVCPGDPFEFLRHRFAYRWRCIAQSI